MRMIDTFYINGQWVAPAGSASRIEVVNPATEEVCAHLTLGSGADVDRAVAAARAAFGAWSQTEVSERLAILKRVVEIWQARMGDLAAVITEEMGAPLWLSGAAQAPSGMAHFAKVIDILSSYAFETSIGTTLLRREPVGVVGMITPWNWPANQIACKVAPALAAGCTMVLKPSEMTPGSAVVIAEILHAAGVPAGVFNLVHGDGPGVGSALSAHPDVDMMSFTGSTRAGVAVAMASAPTVKRVHQELGGKSANIILPDADLERAVKHGVMSMMTNSGQSCNAPSRMLVAAQHHERAAEIAAGVAGQIACAMPLSAPRGAIGPISNGRQFERVQGFLREGQAEGARLVAGGEGRPEGFNRGYFTRASVFAGVEPGMTLAREEIFGPVLSILPYKDVDHAVEMANDTVYGLSGYVTGGDVQAARAVARRLRTGNVHVNGAGVDYDAPFGGYKQSGNGREWGRFGFEEFLEVKAIMGGAG
jgi:aldehyde dehydrogenase (NAD+)